MDMLILDLKGGGSIKRLLIISFVIILDALIAFQTFAYAEIITEDEIFVTLYEAKKIPYLIQQDDVKIIWTVEDSKIASISSRGKVKGLSVGKTKITAMAGEISNNCTLYVKEPLPSLETSYKSNTIFGFEPSSKYIINDKTYISDTDGKIPIQNEWLGKTIKISKKNTIEKCCSDSISLFIEHMHDFFILSTVAPTCLLSGYTIHRCICGETLNDDFVPATGHLLSGFSYDEDGHYQKCLNETCDYIKKGAHNFLNGCDTTCNTCGFKRVAEHQFDGPCDTNCNICNYVRTVSHKYESYYSDTCIICGFKRDILHIFDNECDAECNICGFTRAIKHKFDNECDEACNICGHLRVIEHKYENPCDEVCDICGYKRKTEHKYENQCDEICDICGCKRTIEHKYENLCDEVCDICGYKRKTEHKYENQCDEICDICGYKRKTEHKYENQCDEICDICGHIREVTHKISKTYSTDDTSHFFECKICGKALERQDHIFDNSCDTKCNVCKFKRAITHDIPDTYYHNRRSHYNMCRICQDVFNKELHIYDDSSDNICNICGFIRSVTQKSNSDNNPKNDSEQTKSDNEKADERAETPIRTTNQKKIAYIDKSQKETNYNKKFIDKIIYRRNEKKYIIAFLGTGIAIVSMVILIIFEHNNPRA